jgi:hypothetical protein
MVLLVLLGKFQLDDLHQAQNINWMDFFDTTISDIQSHKKWKRWRPNELAKWQLSSSPDSCCWTTFKYTCWVAVIQIKLKKTLLWGHGGGTGWRCWRRMSFDAESGVTLKEEHRGAKSRPWACRRSSRGALGERVWVAADRSSLCSGVRDQAWHWGRGCGGRTARGKSPKQTLNL